MHMCVYSVYYTLYDYREIYLAIEAAAAEAVHLLLIHPTLSPTIYGKDMFY